MLSDMPASLAIHPPDVCPISGADRSQHSNMSTDKAGYCFPPGTVSNGSMILFCLSRPCLASAAPDDPLRAQA